MNMRQRAIPLVALYLSLCVCAVSSTSNPEGSLRIRVTDTQGYPVEGAEIQVNEKTAGRTGPDGFLIIEPPPCPCDVSVLRDGYRGRRTRVTKDDGPVLKIILVPIREEASISVTATVEPTMLRDLPRAQDKLETLDIRPNLPESVVEAAAATPAVGFIGTGGLSVTPTIRGTGRRRVLILLNGARVLSDRRAGTSASFIPVDWVQETEIIRGPGSVYFGSDAIGGVWSISTVPDRSTAFSSLFTAAGTGDNGVQGSVMFQDHSGDHWWHGALSYADASDYQSPTGKIHHSGFQTGAVQSVYGWESGRIRTTFLVLASEGKHIGKPDRDNDPFTRTENPSRFDHYLLGNLRVSRFGGKGDLNILLAWNPFAYTLTKEDFRSGDLESSKTSGTNETLTASWTIPVAERLSLQVGAEHFIRRNLTMTNYQQSVDFVSDSIPLDGADRSDSSVYAAMQTDRNRPLSFMAGVRATRHTTDVVLDDARISETTTSVSWQTGLNVRFSPGVYGFVNASRGFRFPSLSERYYTGLTGRKCVIANPHLKPESSFELDTGIRLNADHGGLAIFAFHNRIEDMIERYRLPDQIYTHDNLYVGTIQGFEVEGFYSPSDWLELGSAYTHYSGRSSDGASLNDVPSHRLLFSASLYLNHVTISGLFERVSRKSDPGPAETSHAAYSRLDVRLSWFLSQGWQVYLKGQNLMNRAYYPSADPDVPLAMGRSLRVGLQVRFPMSQ